jgi:Protein of unknown function (DUF3144)
MVKPDEKFFERADEHINLSNQQLAKANAGKVSASMMYSLARFNAWISAMGHYSAKEMKDAKRETIQYFVAEYEKMLEENLDDYIKHFDDYMRGKELN